MLEKLRVRNLGCLDENIDSVDFSQETVLIGPNNSGKSTFLAGLNILKSWILYQGLHWSTSLYDFQNWQEAVYKHEENRTILIDAIFDSTKREIMIS